MRNNQKGFSIIHMLLFIVVLGIIGFTGWYVYDTQQKTEGSFNKVENQQTSTTKKDETKTRDFVLPADWQWFDNKELGFKFAYPNEYGNFSPKTEGDGSYTEDLPTHRVVHASSNPSPQYTPGSEGAIEVIVFKSKNVNIYSRKYGPMIKLVDDKLIVTETYPDDMGENKLGEEYKDANKKIASTQMNGKIKIFTLESGDEGCMNYTMLFEQKNTVNTIELPDFCDGSYGPEENTVENDKSKYNELYDNILKSIQAI